MNILLSILGVLQVILAGPTVMTSLGRIQGAHDSDCDIYMGIPYAQPPVGDLMFRAPVPVEEWDTIMNAIYPQFNCVQEKSRFSAAYTSRDCLYLNVFVPRNTHNRYMPVMVWFHGGSFATGGTGAATDSTLRHDMSFLAQQLQCVVVTINYRLNMFGYLYLSDLSDRYDSNCGLRDQLLALKWVNEHIASFGGNPHNVTLYGQSAGAASILAIMSIPSANKLYKRVILMSPPMKSFLTVDEAHARAQMYLRMADIKEKKLDQVQHLSNERIASVNRNFMMRMVLNGDMRCAFSPVVDGDLLKKMPMEGALQSRCPMLIGYVANEADLFGEKIPKTVMPFVARLLHVDVPEVEKDDRFQYADRFLQALSTDMFFAPIDSFYAAYHGPKQHYVYDYITPQMEAQGLRCCHSYELPVIFGWSTPLCDPTDSATMEVGETYRKMLKKFIQGKK